MFALLQGGIGHIDAMYEKDVLQGLILTAVLMIILFGSLTVAIFKAADRKEKWWYNFFGVLTFLLTLVYVYRLWEWVESYRHAKW